MHLLDPSLAVTKSSEEQDRLLQLHRSQESFSSVKSFVTGFSLEQIFILKEKNIDLKLSIDHGYDSVPQEAVEILQDAEVLVIDGTCLALLLYDLPKAKWAQHTWAVGRLLKSGGSRVIAFVRRPRNKTCYSFDMAVTDLSTIFDQCDYICNILPSTENTKGLLDNDVLRNCKKKPVFINVGRGDIIKNSSIIKALREGWISRAILDVFEDEPPSQDCPLWSMPEVSITPHVGAMPRVEGIAKFIASNYLNYINGEPLQNVVDWQSEY